MSYTLSIRKLVLTYDETKSVTCKREIWKLLTDTEKCLAKTLFVNSPLYLRELNETEKSSAVNLRNMGLAIYNSTLISLTERGNDIVSFNLSDKE